MKSIIELAKEAGFTSCLLPEEADDLIGGVFIGDENWIKPLERFAALVRADLMKQVMDTCEAEYKRYDEMVEQDDAGHEEATAVIHLMRKLEKLK